MNIHQEIQNELYEFSRGELSADEERRVSAHLALCKRCTAAAAEIRELVDAVPVASPKASDERPEQYWSSFSYNVINRIRMEQQRGSVRKISFVEYAQSVLLHQRRAVVSIGVGLAVVAALVFTWQLRQTEVDAVRQLASGVQENQPPTVQARYNQYLRKSQVLMVGLMNMKQEAGGQLDLSAERDLSRQLVMEARYLHDQDIGEHAKQLIHDLEKILIELANIEEQHDLPDVEILRAGIRQENLLFKIRMGERLTQPQHSPDQKERQSKKGESS